MWMPAGCADAKRLGGLQQELFHRDRKHRPLSWPLHSSNHISDQRNIGIDDDPDEFFYKARGYYNYFRTVGNIN